MAGLEGSRAARTAKRETWTRSPAGGQSQFRQWRSFALRADAPWRDVPEEYGHWESAANAPAEPMAGERALHYDQITETFLGILSLAAARSWIEFVDAA